MNVFLLPALGKWGVAPVFPLIHPQRDHAFFVCFGVVVFVCSFVFAPKWQLGQCWGNKAGLEGWRGSLHLLLPGFNSVSVREKTIFSLKQ